MSQRVHNSPHPRDARPSAPTTAELVDQLRVAGIGLLHRFAASAAARLGHLAEQRPCGTHTSSAPAFSDHRVIQELAKVFDEREASKLLLLHADFPLAMLPQFTTPQVYWAKVARKAQNGALHGGLMRIVMQASELYPANSVFARYLEENGHALRNVT